MIKYAIFSILFSIFLNSADAQKFASIKNAELTEANKRITTSVKKELQNDGTYITTIFPPPTFKDSEFFIPGQLCQHLRQIHQDKNGDMWFGTNVYGIMRYRSGQPYGQEDTLTYFMDNENFRVGRGTGIVEDKEGNIWFAEYGGLTKYDIKTQIFKTFDKNQGLKNEELWNVIIDNKGMFWVASTEGVYQFNGEKFTEFPIPKAKVKDTTTVYAYNRITSVMQDRKGRYWFGTDGFGITRYDPAAEKSGIGTAFTTITKEDGLPDNNVGGMMEDKNGNIWIGTSFGGISMFDGNRYNNYTRDGVVNGKEISAMYEDSKGNFWFAVENNGVYRYDGSTFSHLYKENGLITNGILSIYEDKSGDYWFGGWGGLFRYDGKKFFKVTKDGPWD